MNTTTHAIVTVNSDEPTSLTSGYFSGADVTFQNLSSTEYVYLGGDGVAKTSFGYRLSPGSAFSVELSQSGTIYAISESGPVDVAVLYNELELGQ